ncbi:hypothetical protein BZB76_2207 [Actinomadura pelletieri DSM 43383]|uniref:DUF3558 domain-containing protein n=1 Tax=Actinomadura pelletieri DSM 43383 TaxID=1120940 RepID=A0A495QTU0_9ACTN|nr:hypothetical protein [Actinomadura pelletieri]RKS76841.1 hypothetical protein BZB76_2207 [Actinomadura pelletieri DSM 43383]
MLAAAAVLTYLVVPGPGEGDAAARSEPARAAMPGSGGRDRAAPAGPRVARALPPPCGTVSQGTVDRVVPGARRSQNANSTLTTCTYSSAGAEFPWLRVEAHLYAPGNTVTPVRDAEGSYDARWAEANDAPAVRTITLERQPGVGNEAYRWFKADETEPAVVGQLTARTGNTVVTVSYGEHAPDEEARESRAESSLATVTAIAREVLAALNDF